MTQCNQLIRLARDARKSAQEKLAPPPDPKKPADPVAPPKAVAGPGDAAPKLPAKADLPAAEAQEKALRSVRQVFQAEYAKGTAEVRRALAKRLLQEAEETKGDQAAQFVLLREAADLAAQTSDVATAFAAIDAMGKVFAIEALALKVATLSKLPTATTHELAGPAIEACLDVVGDAVGRDHYDLASFVLKKAETLTKNPTNVTLQAKVQARVKEVGEIRKERDNLREAEKVLADKPDDPAANLKVGRFTCYLKSDWVRGLPMLRKGGHPGLKKIVETELSGPASPELRMDLADAWWKIAEEESSSLGKASLHARARCWYERALPGLSGFPRTRVEKLLHQLEEEEIARWAVNLLRLVDPKKDSISGNWTFEGESLVSPVAMARLQVPYTPPEEYDLKLVAARKGGVDALSPVLPTGNKQFYITLDGWGGTISGVGEIDGKGPNQNESGYRGSIFADGKPRTVVCSIRKNRVTVSVDGTTIVDWKADFKRVSVSPQHGIPVRKAVILSVYQSAYHISQMWLIPVSGQGQKLR